MKEIKFRAWDHFNDQMWNPKNDMFKFIAMIDHLKSGGNEIELMQYTGLVDKNGVEIYEGDIVHMGDTAILYVIEWVDTGLRACQNGNKSTAGIKFHQKWIKVIGNIYENANLLNQK